MASLVQKYKDAEVGHVVTLKSGSPKMTLVKFVPAEPSVVEPGIQNATYADSAHVLNAQVMWCGENGTLGQANVPIDALVFEGGANKPQDPALAKDQKRPGAI